MVNRKDFRTRGKLPLSRYFQKFDIGSSVAVLREVAEQPRFPKRFQGRTGIVEGKRGSSYIINIKDTNKPKKLIIKPIHLRKIK